MPYVYFQLRTRKAGLNEAEADALATELSRERPKYVSRGHALAGFIKAAKQREASGEVKLEREDMDLIVYAIGEMDAEQVTDAMLNLQNELMKDLGARPQDG